MGEWAECSPNSSCSGRLWRMDDGCSSNTCFSAHVYLCIWEPSATMLLFQENSKTCIYDLICGHTDIFSTPPSLATWNATSFPINVIVQNPYDGAIIIHVCMLLGHFTTYMYVLYMYILFYINNVGGGIVTKCARI